MIELIKFFVHVAYGHCLVLSDDIAIHCVLSVLWMTSCFHIMAICSDEHKIHKSKMKNIGPIRDCEPPHAH